MYHLDALKGKNLMQQYVLLFDQLAKYASWEATKAALNIKLTRSVNVFSPSQFIMYGKLLSRKIYEEVQTLFDIVI